MRRCWPGIVVLVAVVTASCTRDHDLVVSFTTDEGGGHLTIRTERTHYQWSELHVVRRIRASLTNTSAQTWYARLGDRFDASLDQARLFIAEGSSGSLEHAAPGPTWRPMARGFLVEGVRMVALRPGTTYVLEAVLPGPAPATGTFRLRVDYYPKLEDPPAVVSLTDSSNPFEIR